MALSSICPEQLHVFKLGEVDRSDRVWVELVADAQRQVRVELGVGEVHTTSYSGARRTPSPPLGCRFVRTRMRDRADCSRLVRGTRVPHDVLKMWCPRLRRARPDLGCRFKPRHIVDRPCLQEGYFRHRLDRAEYRGPAGRAEPPLRCALIVLAGGLERGERVALDHECFARYAHDRRERRSGLALTVRAVANPLPNWLSLDAIGHATAQAAACNGSRYLGHISNPTNTCFRGVPIATSRSDRGRAPA